MGRGRRREEAPFTKEKYRLHVFHDGVSRRQAAGRLSPPISRPDRKLKFRVRVCGVPAKRRACHFSPTEAAERRSPRSRVSKLCTSVDGGMKGTSFERPSVARVIATLYTRENAPGPRRATFHPLQMLIIAFTTIYLFPLREEFWMNQHNRMLKKKHARASRGNRNVIVLSLILFTLTLPCFTRCAGANIERTGLSRF